MMTPEYLYKFRRVDKYASDLFCRRKMYFNTPGQLNDPFEFEPVFDLNCTEDSWMTAIESEIIENNPAWSEAQIKRELLRLKDRHYPPLSDDIDRFREGYRKRLSRVGVFSASERWDSITMWSHYADEHRGLCIEINPQALPTNIEFHPVRYKKHRPIINLFSDRSRANSIVSSTKNEEWGYEQEWRILLEAPPDKAGFPREVDLPDGLIAGVILGARIPEEDRSRVRDWAKLLDHPPRFYEAHVDKQDYRVKRREVVG